MGETTTTTTKTETAAADRPFHRVRAADVARFFDVHRATVADWARRGMPMRPDKTTSLPACVAWYGCFGPGRTESWRDDTLKEHIQRMLDE